MMKLKLDANQQEAVMKELRLDASFTEVDMTNMMEISGGIKILIVGPPPYITPPRPIGGGIYTTLAFGEEG